MKSIDLEGLPEPVAAVIALLVRTAKEQMVRIADTPTAAPKARAAELPLWPGKVLGSLRRDEIYTGVEGVSADRRR